MRYSQHYQPASTPIHIGEVVELRAAITAKLVYSVGKDISGACDRDWLIATALAVRDRIIDRWLESSRRTEAEQKKRVYYLSIE
jgi:starch phosphorylase